jgi:hypothetical protein
MGISFNSCGENYEVVKKCFVSGFFLNAAILHSDGYKILAAPPTAKSIATIHPSSVLFSKKPICILYNESVGT